MPRPRHLSSALLNKMQSHAVNHIDYGAMNLDHVPYQSVKAVASHALREIPGGKDLVSQVFHPKQNIVDLPRPRVMNQKLYGPYDFGR